MTGGATSTLLTSQGSKCRNRDKMLLLQCAIDWPSLYICIVVRWPQMKEYIYISLRVAQVCGVKALSSLSGFAICPLR